MIGALRGAMAMKNATDNAWRPQSLATFRERDQPASLRASLLLF